MHVRFGDLDYIIMMEGELAMAPAAVRPLHSADLGAIAEALKELQLHALGPTPSKATNSSISTMGG